MEPITIDIYRDNMTKNAESLLWKYGVAVENTGVRQANNVKSDSDSRPVDSRLISDSMVKRAAKAADLMHDFGATVAPNSMSDDRPPQPIIRYTVNMSSRWLSSTAILREALEKYILDGIMTDYLNVTAPSEVQM
jgi:hypothetical protein